MAQGFYEILSVGTTASNDDISGAYHTRLAELVRRLRAARKQGADVTILEGQERGLREAMQVLSDPVRRQRYDAFQRASRDGMPSGAEDLWDVAKASLVDPVALAAVAVIRSTTDLDVGNPFPESPKPRRWVSRPAPVPVAPPPVSIPIEAAVPTPAPVPQPAELEPTERVIESTASELEPTELDADPVFSLDDPSAIAAHFGNDGRFLHTVRELRQMDMSDLATETRISLRYLEAIEGNDFDALPAATFVRGYVKEVARALGVSDAAVVDGYMELFSRHRG
jgi:hypothetical protein